VDEEEGSVVSVEVSVSDGGVLGVGVSAGVSVRGGRVKGRGCWSIERRQNLVSGRFFGLQKLSRRNVTGDTRTSGCCEGFAGVSDRDG
jgi:hypothetical protein